MFSSTNAILWVAVVWLYNWYRGKWRGFSKSDTVCGQLRYVYSPQHRCGCDEMYSGPVLWQHKHVSDVRVPWAKWAQRVRAEDPEFVRHWSDGAFRGARGTFELDRRTWCLLLEWQISGHNNKPSWARWSKCSSLKYRFSRPLCVARRDENSSRWAVCLDKRSTIFLRSICIRTTEHRFRTLLVDGRLVEGHGLRICMPISLWILMQYLFLIVWCDDLQRNIHTERV